MGEEAQDGAWAGFVHAAQEEILVVTHCFDPAGDPAGFGIDAPASVTVRFSGRRQEVSDRTDSGDLFVHEEVVEAVEAGAGAISVTARIGDVNPGRWEVHAEAICAGRSYEAPRAGRWRPWRGPKEGEDKPVATRLKPLTRVPGLVRFAWLATATLGIALGVVVQALVAATQGTAASSVRPVSLAALAAGVAGAKAWFVVKHREDRRTEGWCVQGFVVGFVIAALTILAAAGASIPQFFDAATPGLFLGLAVGRLGCLSAGCCYGRPTTSRWGLWISDQRVLRKRVPTQLIESGLLAAIGIGALAVALVASTQGAGIFVASAAVYVVGRQPILALRAEPTRLVKPERPGPTTP